MDRGTTPSSAVGSAAGAPPKFSQQLVLDSSSSLPFLSDNADPALKSLFHKTTIHKNPRITYDLVAALVNVYGEAWRTGDLERLSWVFTQDVMYIEKPSKYFEGVGRVKQLWRETIVGRQKEVSFRLLEDDMSLDLTRGCATVKWEASWTNSNEKKMRGLWIVLLRLKHSEEQRWKICWWGVGGHQYLE